MKNKTDNFDELLKIEQAKEDKRMLRVDVKQKAKGFTHKVSGWVHPKNGGDDYQIDLYSKGKQSKEEIVSFFKRRSKVTNDWKQTELV